jgi:hypothetical protein
MLRRLIQWLFSFNYRCEAIDCREPVGHADILFCERHRHLYNPEYPGGR